MKKIKKVCEYIVFTIAILVGITLLEMPILILSAFIASRIQGSNLIDDIFWTWTVIDLSFHILFLIMWLGTSDWDTEGGGYGYG